MYIPEQLQRICFLHYLPDSGVFRTVSLSIPGCQTVLFRTHGGIDVPGWHFHETGRLWMSESGHIFSAGGKDFLLIIVLSAVAILYGAFATMMQKDLKYINAYSSVSHLRFCIAGHRDAHARPFQARSCKWFHTDS